MIMAKNSKDYQMPKGTKYKVSLEKNGAKYFMMLYAESDVDAHQTAVDVWGDAGWEVSKVEEA